jgi:cytochrome c2
VHFWKSCGTLRAFFDDPQQFALGTTMPATSIGDEQILNALLDLLQTLR